MPVTAIKGYYHDGKIEPLEEIPYQDDKNVVIIFVDDGEGKLWDEAVASDFIKGYSEKDTAYDKL